jgi:hypothetical protein
MKNLIKPILIVAGILLTVGCSETTSVKKLVDLQIEEKQAVIAMSDRFNTLLRQKTTLNFIKTCMKQSDKTSFMMDYLSPSFNSEQKEMAMKVIGHLFADKPHQDLRAQTGEDDFFAVSPTVTRLTKKLTSDIKNAMLGTANEGQSTDQLTAGVKSVIMDFKAEVQENNSLTLDESRILIAFTEFENNSIGETVNMANALNSNSGGRTQGWFDDLVQIVVTAVVAAVVVVAVIATVGVVAGVTAAVWFGTAVEVGLYVGAAYGAIIGYSQAVDHNMYWTDFNVFNVGGAFLNWDSCSNDPGNWQCA